MKINLKKISIAVLFLLIISSCGYHFAGMTSELPSHIKGIAIPILVNGTTEPLIEITVTNKIIQTFIADGRLRVLDSSKADAVLKGRITAFSLTTLSFDKNNSVLEYRVTIQCELTFEDVKDRKIIWKDSAVSQSADYKVSSNVSATKAAKDRAIEEASKRLATDLVTRIFEGF